MVRTASLTALLLLAPVAFATDGVLEINQACATSTTGCFPGDTGGFPVTITSPGSYRLTSNLTVPNENASGIVVSANDVGIDLNNFAILGPVTCSGSPLTCTPNGTGSGVALAGFPITTWGTSVKNGSITGMGGGVEVGYQSEVANLRVRSNGSGIFADDFSTVSGNTASGNGGWGIYAGPHSTVSGNTASGNVHGILSLGEGGVTVSNNTASGNGIAGIFASDGSTVSGNTASGNGDVGITASTGSTVSGNTASGNRGAGIVASTGCTVQRNTVRGNTGFGLDLGADTTYRENTITSSRPGTGGTVSGGVNLGSNYCAGTATASAACP